MLLSCFIPDAPSASECYDCIYSLDEPLEFDPTGAITKGLLLAPSFDLNFSPVFLCFPMQI